MAVDVTRIIKIADDLISICGTRDPLSIADELDITVIYRNFKAQRGAYSLLLKSPFIFVKEDLHPIMQSIVIFHEIGHHLIHRQEAILAGGFHEFELFNMRGNRLEYEANIFAAQASLPDDEILEYIYQGFDIQQIASVMGSDINLVALKCDNLRLHGYNLRKQEHRSDFLKPSHQAGANAEQMCFTDFDEFGGWFDFPV